MMTGVRELIRHHGVGPRKELGQHHLLDQGAVARMVAAAELQPGEAVLEVGAGLGVITRVLAPSAGRVVAVELDQRLIPVLQEELADYANVQIVQGDILALDPAELMGGPYKVVANLPYGLASAVLRQMLEARLPPQRMVVTAQREVAERIVARDGRLSLLAVSVQFYGQPRLLFRLHPHAFYPPPDVDSAVLRIDLHQQPPVQVDDVAEFFRVVRAGFCQPRKQLRNSLAAGLQLEPRIVEEALRELGLDPRLRAENLRLEDWARVANLKLD